MVTRESLMDRLPAPLHSLQLAFRTRHFEGVPTRDLIRAADYLNRVFEASPSPSPVRPAAAGVLVFLYHLVDGRLRRAPLGPDALPQVDGVVWRRGSGLAGLIEDIDPFGMLDVWVINADQPVRAHHHARHRPVPQRVNAQVSGGGAPHLNPPVNGGAQPVPTGAQIEGALQQPEYHDMSVADWAGRVLDVGSSGLGLIAVFTEAAVAGFVIDALGSALGIVSTLMSVPQAWAAGDRIWAFNNEGWAYCTALSDMASRFRDEDLGNPEHWPQIRLPLEPVYPTGDTVADQIARRALREGFDLAVNTVQQLERSPRMLHLQVQGHPVQMALTGRRLLIALNLVAQSRHTRVVDYLRFVVERRAGQSMAVMNWGH